MTFRAAAWCFVLLGVSACGTDARLKRDGGGLAFAPVRNDIDAEKALGPPVFAAGVPMPSRGFVVAQSSAGYLTHYVFDAVMGRLTGIWNDPAQPGATAPPPEIHAVELSKNERNAFVRMINLAWGARRPAPGAATVHDVTETVWLLDGSDYKALDGYRAGLVIESSVIAVAQKHKVVRGN